MTAVSQENTLTKRIDWEKDQLRMKLVKNRTVDHTWRAQNDVTGDWKPLEDRPNHSRGIALRSKHHQTKMRQLEIIRLLTDNVRRIKKDGSLLLKARVQELCDETQALIDEVSVMDLQPSDAKVVEKAKATFGLKAYVNGMRGLVIKREFLDLIFAGRKAWEIRGSRTKARGPIALIESGSSTVVGICTLEEVIGPLTLNELSGNARNIGLKASDIKSKPYGSTYAWVLGNVKQLSRSVPYSHPHGAVVWVKLAPAIARKVTGSYQAD